VQVVYVEVAEAERENLSSHSALAVI
jgi:hypothetical protein